MSRFAVAITCLLLLACRDGGEQAYARARARYDEAVLSAQLPDATAWDEVLRELDAVPPGSPRHGEAQRLRRNVLQARTRVRAPLAIVKDERSFPPEVIAKLRACNALAERAGRDGGVTAADLAALDACRVEAEKLELHFSHGAHAEDAPRDPAGPGAVR